MNDNDPNEFSTPLHILMGPVEKNPNPQPLSQTPPDVQQCNTPQQSLDVYPLIQHVVNINYKDSLHTIIIITILFILFSSSNFKEFCKTVPFLCITDGEFNIQSLIILGFTLGICYIIVKNYLI